MSNVARVLIARQGWSPTQPGADPAFDRADLTTASDPHLQSVLGRAGATGTPAMPAKPEGTT